MPHNTPGSFENDSSAALFVRLGASEIGLTAAAAAQRLAEFGPNETIRADRLHPLLKLLSYFKDPLIITLLAAAAVSGLTGELKNAAIIAVMALLSVGLDFYQEHRSGQAAQKIANRMAVTVRLRRDGQEREIPAREVVPGDIVLVSAGDIIPADGKIVTADDLFVNESTLTGESMPVEKSAAAAGKTASVYAGTTVVSGYADILAVRTGTRTEYGRIAASVGAADTNAFEKGTRDFGKLILTATIVLVLVIFLVNALMHRDLIDSLIFSIAVAVGITPELLPMIMSVNMARGAIRMSKRGVIVKRLNAIPDFGSMDVLCTDKTGTLTEDRITLVRHLDTAGIESESVLKQAYVNGYFESGVKSLLDQAILAHETIAIEGYEKLDEIPYDFERKRSSIVYRANGNTVMATKGAPEEIFKIATKELSAGIERPFDGAARTAAEKVYHGLCDDGFRVLAIAVKDVVDGQGAYPASEERDMVLVGFIAFYDPPKASAAATLKEMRENGIEVKILTGDSALVARSVCRSIGLDVETVVSSEDLPPGWYESDQLPAVIRGAGIIARLAPHEKEHIIAGLRRSGLVVGYLGDGINDAPSLKAADVGISVENAVDVARETADIILSRKELDVLLDGVIEGRKTFGNTMKYLMMGLSSNFGNMFSLIGAVLFLPFFPMLPGQILLNNFLYDLSQLTIPSDNVDAEYLKKPKHWDIRFIRRYMLIFGPISSIFDFFTFYLLYGVLHLSAAQFQTGWFLESLATQTLVVFVIRTRRLPFLQSRPSGLLLASVAAVLAAALLIVFTEISHFFGFVHPTLPALLGIALIVGVYLVLVEGVKHWFYRRYPE